MSDERKQGTVVRWDATSGAGLIQSDVADDALVPFNWRALLVTDRRTLAAGDRVSYDVFERDLRKTLEAMDVRRSELEG